MRKLKGQYGVTSVERKKGARPWGEKKKQGALERRKRKGSSRKHKPFGKGGYNHGGKGK